MLRPSIPVDRAAVRPHGARGADVAEWTPRLKGSRAWTSAFRTSRPTRQSSPPCSLASRRSGDSSRPSSRSTLTSRRAGRPPIRPVASCRASTGGSTTPSSPWRRWPRQPIESSSEPRSACWSSATRSPRPSRLRQSTASLAAECSSGSGRDGTSRRWPTTARIRSGASGSCGSGSRPARRSGPRRRRAIRASSSTSIGSSAGRRHCRCRTRRSSSAETARPFTSACWPTETAGSRTGFRPTTR